MSEVIVIGGGVIGLAISIELRLKGIDVKILRKKELKMASLAAAGMLAPHAEKIALDSLFCLCQNSLNLYPQWIAKLKNITGKDVGYLPTGIIAPTFEVSTGGSVGGIWWDRSQLEDQQGNLAQDITGAWWYPEDGQVNNRLLIESLNQAALNLGVKIEEHNQVLFIEDKAGKVKQLITSAGEISSQCYILANGAYARELIDLPVRPVKGQMLALQMPKDSPLTRVIFGDSVYLVPRADGRLFIGATVEDVGWSGGNSADGIRLLLERAIRLYPPVRDYPIQEMWWGFRPATPDEAPLLGSYFAENLILALGHYRNGILLAPITGQLICDLLVEGKKETLIQEFSPHRFVGKG